MTIQRPLGLLLASALASSAAAQSASPPLNLKLPPSAVPATSSSAPRPASASTSPGVYYGDTSGTTDASLAANAPADTCDDATYNQPQVHGSVGMGVVAGNHLSGNYQTGTVSVSKAFGDCDHPTGGMSFTISGGQGHFNDHRFGR